MYMTDTTGGETPTMVTTGEYIQRYNQNQPIFSNERDYLYFLQDMLRVVIENRPEISVSEAAQEVVSSTDILLRHVLNG